MLGDSLDTKLNESQKKPSHPHPMQNRKEPENPEKHHFPEVQ